MSIMREAKRLIKQVAKWYTKSIGDYYENLAKAKAYHI